MRSICFYLVLVFTIVNLYAVEYDVKEWTRKQNREEIARVLAGDYETALRNMRAFLSVHPDDAEVMYGMALAYSSIDEPDTAWLWCQRALQHGLPIDRFLAGPRDALQSLTSLHSFQKRVAEMSVQLLHGPMLGAMTGHSVRVWVRTVNPAKIRVRYSEQPSFTNAKVTAAVKTLPENDFTAVVPVTGLTPVTDYYYQLIIDDHTLEPVHRFKTLPQERRPASFTAAWGGCAAYNPNKEYMWHTIQTHNPDIMLILGDNVYIDHPESPGTQQFCYYQRQSSQPWRDLVAGTPIFAIWDDHDFGVNDDFGGPLPFAPVWKVKALEIFKQNWVNPWYSHDEKYPGVWFDFMVGDVQFIMLDCRYYRLPSTDENPTMLGPVQKQWLKDRLKASKATFKVICSSVPWADGAKGLMEGRIDTWRGYTQERQELFEFLSAFHIDGVVLLSADRHRTDAWLHERENDYPLWEFENSRLTNIHVHDLMPGAFWGYNKTCMFGLFEFDTTLPDPQLVYKVISIDGQEINRITLYKSQLTQ